MLDNLEHAVDILEELREIFANLPKPFFSLESDTYRVLLNKRMRSRAGVAMPRNGIVQVNPNLVKTPADFRSVVIHELCHLAVSRTYKRALPHGPQWKKLMTLLGQDPKRCHNFEIPNRHLRRKFSLNCSCQEHKVSSVIINRIKNGTTYRCRGCKEPLK